jgi:A/G-specific adenine glycosylase
VISVSPLLHFSKKLLRWYRATRRDLPWRASRDPYAIWVSEVMLQQTQVATVIPFFTRFMKRFPTIVSLAAATEQEVLRHWEGLGYYRRARHLHQAAQVVVAQHAGELPAEADSLAKLPGLGRYTVGAILSQAHDARLAIVDANVARILTRLFAWQDELESKTTQDWLWQTAERMLPRQQAGDHNQALMELGQTICTTGEPSCLLCPLRDDCQGRARGLAASLPRRRARQATTMVRDRCIVLHKSGQVLLCQRSSDANRWANMWEFPTHTLDDAGDVPTQLEMLTGYRLKQPTPLGSLTYGITRYSVELSVIEARYAGGRAHRRHYQQLVWVTPETLSEYPLSVPQRRVAARWVSPPTPRK